METIKDIIAEMRDAGGYEFEYFADRIEQAVTNCNQFKMREALKEIQATLSVYHTTSLSNQETVDTFRKVIERALSAPPRNCDLYATEDEAYQAHLKAMDDIPLETHVYYETWLFDQAKGETK